MVPTASAAVILYQSSWPADNHFLNEKQEGDHLAVGPVQGEKLLLLTATDMFASLSMWVAPFVWTRV